jgi:hypothetical protein
VEFSAYQRVASETSQLRLGGPQGAIAPMLGLASETGSILNVYKKYLRDGIDLAAKNKQFRGAQPHPSHQAELRAVRRRATGPHP